MIGRIRLVSRDRYRAGHMLSGSNREDSSLAGGMSDVSNGRAKWVKESMDFIF